MNYFTRTLAKAAAALLMTCAPVAANAELLLSDNFDYDAGDLYNQGGWIKLDKKTNNPIQVIASPLTYPGYQPSASGKAALMDGQQATDCQKLKKQFSEEAVVSGKLFYSALVKPTEINGNNKYALLGLAGKNYSGFGDGVGNSSVYAVVSMAPGSADGKVKFGVAASTASPTYAATEYDLNSTYLVVASYDFASKDISLWVNPADANADATVTLAGKGSISTTNGVQGICLYQNPSSLAYGKAIIDAVRVGTSMADIFGSEGGDQGGDDNDDASATASTYSIDFNGVFQGATSAVQTVTINAQNVTEPLTLTSTNSAFKVSPATIQAADAIAGATVSITFAPKAAQDYAGSIKVMCGAKELTSIAVKGTGVAVETPMNYAMLSNMIYEGTATDYAYYSVESRFGVVTHVDNPGNRFFIQDMSGALEVSTEMVDGGMPAIQEGSKIKLFYVTPIDGKLYLAVPVEASAISQGTPKTPTPYSLADIQQDPQSYWNKLVTIEDVEFAKAGEAFAASSTAATDPRGKTFNVRPFAGTDLIGTAIPAKGSVSGILLAKNGSVVWPRKAADIEAAAAAEEPEINVKVTTDFTDVAPINTDTRLATLTIEAKELPAPAQIWLGGANRALFSLSREEIPAGTGTYEVVVTYTPNAIGVHKATINIDATPTTLSGTYALTAKAYDPANLPSITVPASVEQFNAAVGQTDKKQFAISSANMIEYGTVAFESQSVPGTFIINSSSLYPNISNQFTVTFTPKTAGTFTATIKVEGLKAETRYIKLTGVATGDTPVEEKEGTELRLDASNPLKIMTETFEGVTKNRPIDIKGWDNVAMEGTRAWWGFTFADDKNSAAKVTAYDSKAEDDTPAQMMLVTPALDFKNAGSKLLTFRVMGDMLPEAAERADLEVLYIEDAEYMESFGNIGIPCIADQNGEWIDLVIDLEDMNIADVFFIGFRYKGERGHNSSAVYYIDDVTWGRTDIPFIKVRTADGLNAAMYGMVMTGNIGETATSDPLTVTATNLTGPITIGFSGANPSKFSASTETLPATGGTFTVHFTPEERGVHQVYVDLKADDAPTMSVPVEALGVDPSGITDIEIDDAAGDAYNLQGIRVGAKDMRSGIYIINGKKAYLRR